MPHFHLARRIFRICPLFLLNKTCQNDSLALFHLSHMKANRITDTISLEFVGLNFLVALIIVCFQLYCYLPMVDDVVVVVVMVAIVVRCTSFFLYFSVILSPVLFSERVIETPTLFYDQYLTFGLAKFCCI